MCQTHLPDGRFCESCCEQWLRRGERSTLLTGLGLLPFAVALVMLFEAPGALLEYWPQLTAGLAGGSGALWVERKLSRSRERQFLAEGRPRRQLPAAKGRSSTTV